MAFFEIFIMVNSIGRMMGKLNMTIRVPLLCALEAIAETMVREDDKPMEAKSIVRTNRIGSCTGFHNTNE